MCIVDRIRLLSKAQNLSLTNLESILGFGNGTIGKWVKQSPSCDKIKLVADYLHTTTDFLISGTAEKSELPVSISPEEKELLEYYKDLDDVSKASVLGKAEGLAEAARAKKKIAKAARPKHPQPKTITPSVMVETESTPEAEEEDEDKFIYLDFPALPASAGTGVYIDSDYTEPLKVRADELTVEANYALRVSGNSMQPRYCDGDIVLVQTQPCVEPGEIGIYIYNGEAYIKQFGGNRLISINPDYDDIPITDPDSCYCKGKVIGILDPVKYL